MINDPQATAGPTSQAAIAAEPRTIAVDLDDTLNDFTATLRSAPIPYRPEYGLPEATFHAYLERVRQDAAEAGGLLSTKYSFFRYQIHQECFGLARARPDGIEFMRWLKTRGWRIVVCTHRDLRRANAVTREWLGKSGIPFDHLFIALNKIVFCRAWGIGHLVDDDPFSAEHGERYGVQVHYPVTDKHPARPACGARGFQNFDEVRRWIEK